MANIIPSLDQLIDQFAAIGGVGRKTAARYAYHVLSLSDQEAADFAAAILDAHKNVHRCPICQNLTDGSICSICANEARDRSIICVVQSPQDVNAFEKTREYNGVYHVIHGLISPMEGIMPDQLYIKELVKRAASDEVKEVIMATSPTAEGETTAVYMARLLKPLGVRVTRLAYGMPVGGSLEYADENTLYRALEGRSEL